MLARDDKDSLKRTPLYDLHMSLGGKMVPFAGYDMPVQYPAGVLKEHLHTRSQAGLFDVSHMGQLALRPKSGKVEDAARALERLVPQDILAIAPGRQRYAQFTNTDGGILDDLMVANFGDHLFLVVNAACKAEDEAHLRANLSDDCVIDSLADRALIALQGPKAESALAKLCAEAPAMTFMDAGPHEVAGLACFVSRSGYTGEDGFEISVPAEAAAALADALTAEPEVKPIGLGARDSLRLEAGLPLYGHDLDPETTPVMADLGFALSKRRREEGNFMGAERILLEREQGAVTKRVGLVVEGRQPVREGAAVIDGEGSDVGKVTSGGFAPTLGAPIAMAYVPVAMTAPGTVIQIAQRGKVHQATVTAMPFVPHRYVRAGGK